MTNEKSACEWGWEDNYVDIIISNRKVTSQRDRTYEIFFFSIAATPSVQSAIGHTFVLAAVCRSGHLCSICSPVWSSRPQLQVGDGVSFIFLKMWALSPCVVS